MVRTPTAALRRSGIGLADRQGIAYVSFFPLGGFTPLQSSTLSAVAARLLRIAHRVFAPVGRKVGE